MVTDTKNDASSKLASTLRKMEPSLLAKHLTPAKRSAAHDLDSNSGDKKLKARPEPINEYRGWVVPAKNFKIPHVALNETLTSEIFYQKYIKERRPIVIRGFLRDLIGLEKWRESNEHLKNRAGNEKVVVEVRSNSKDTFGRGNQTTMSFSDFLDLSFFCKVLAWRRCPPDPPGCGWDPALNGRPQHLIEAAKRGRLDQMLFFRRR